MVDLVDMEGVTTVDWIELGLQLVGGLALFLLGMEFLTSSLQAAASGKLKKLLQGATKNRFSAFVSGVLVTAAAQSSSVTTVILVGFSSAGLVSLANSVGVILGANVGSTVTAQIIAFDITRWGLILVAVGFFLRLFRRPQNLRFVGGLIMGLGLIFFGMELMSTGTQPLRDYPPFVTLMGEMKNPLFGILCGLVFTAVVQSSAATTGLTIVLAMEGLLGLEGAIALVLGANIGTCVTALLATIGQPRAALRVAIVHVIFNVGGVLIWLPFLSVLAEIATASVSLFTGEVRAAADIGREVANAHTVFNLINAMLFIGFTVPIAMLAQRLIPEREKASKDGSQTQYLEDFYLTEPETALEQVVAEMVDFLRSVQSLHRKLSDVMLARDADGVRDLSGADDAIDTRQELILSYLGKLSEKELTRSQQAKLSSSIGIVNQIENLGDLLDHVFHGLAMDLIEMDSEMSEPTKKSISELVDRVQDVFDATINAVGEFSEGGAGKVVDLQGRVRERAAEAKDLLSKRLGGRDHKKMRIFRIEIDLIECQSRAAHILAEITREIR